MDRFVGLLIRVRQWRGDAALVTSVKREHLELAQGYFVNQWIASKPRHADQWRVIRSMQNRAPFSSVLPVGTGEGVEYFWNGNTAKAMGAAHLMDGLLVSLLIDSAWDKLWLQAACEELIESADGELEIVKDSVDIRHAAKLEHARVTRRVDQRVRTVDFQARFRDLGCAPRPLPELAIYFKR